MYPITKYSFNMKAIENLYLARYKDSSLFLPQAVKKTNKIKIPDSLKNSEIAASCLWDHPIKLSLSNHVLTFLAT